MMNRRYAAVIGVMIIILMFASCNNTVTAPQVDGSKTDEQTDTIISDDLNSEDEDNEMRDGVICPLCGSIIEKDKLYSRPVAVMIDNHHKAIPQAGLKDADIVYEILSEGNITRYMALFMHGSGIIAGPVRSARSYYIDKSIEYDAIFMHAGGSPEAWDDIARLKISSLNAMSLGLPVYWREKHRQMPHNIYTNIDNARAMAVNKGYRDSGSAAMHSFNSEDVAIHGENALTVSICYSQRYRVSYRYSDEDGNYYRYINDKPHVDENNTDSQLQVKNIIIMKAAHRVVDQEGRREIGLVGRGEGIYITAGSQTPITWEKKGRKEKTTFYIESGQELKLNPGKTWVQVVPPDVSVSLE